MANLKRTHHQFAKAEKKLRKYSRSQKSFRFSLFASSVKMANLKQLSVSDVEKKAADIPDMV